MMVTEAHSIHLPYYPDVATSYDHAMRTDALLRIIEGLFPGAERGGKKVRILDMSCGRGELIAQLHARGFYAVGADQDATCVALSQARGVPTHQADYMSIGKLFRAREFDLVISSHSLEHLENPKVEFAELAILSGGWILVAVPNPLAFYNLYNAVFRRVAGVQQGHLYVWDHRHFKNFLENHMDLQIAAWHGDFLRVFPRAAQIRSFFQKLGIVRPLETALARLFPFFATSIIVVCRAKSGGSPDQ